jgi:hypothetical protein
MASLERSSDLKLNVLNFIAVELAQGSGEGKSQRANRRNPANANAGGNTHVLGVCIDRLLHIRCIHGTGIDKSIHPQGPVITSTWERRQYLGIDVELAASA